MATSHRRSAVSIYWESPQGSACELSPLRDGLLEIELLEGMVAVHSRNCSLVSGDDEVVLAEYEMCMALERCQIEWSRVERTTDTEVERSAYFQQ